METNPSAFVRRPLSSVPILLCYPTFLLVFNFFTNPRGHVAPMCGPAGAGRLGGSCSSEEELAEPWIKTFMVHISAFSVHALVRKEHILNCVAALT